MIDADPQQLLSRTPGLCRQCGMSPRGAMGTPQLRAAAPGSQLQGTPGMGGVFLSRGCLQRDPRAGRCMGGGDSRADPPLHALRVGAGECARARRDVGNVPTGASGVSFPTQPQNHSLLGGDPHSLPAARAPGGGGGGGRRRRRRREKEEGPPRRRCPFKGFLETAPGIHVCSPSPGGGNSML